MLEHDVLALATYQCSSRGYAGAGGGDKSRLEWAGLERAAEEVWLAEREDVSWVGGRRRR